MSQSPSRVAHSLALRALLVLALAMLVPIVPFVAIGELPGDRWLSAVGSDAWMFGATGALLLALDLLLPIPSSLIGALLGGRLGLLAGFAFTFVGLCAGHAIGYGLGRLLPERFASELPRTPTLAVVFLSRPLPVLAEAVAIAAGTERMPLLWFAGSAALGNALYALVLAADGATLLPQGLVGPGLILPMALPVAGYVAWRYFARRARESSRANRRPT